MFIIVKCVDYKKYKKGKKRGDQDFGRNWYSGCKTTDLEIQIDMSAMLETYQQFGV